MIADNVERNSILLSCRVQMYTYTVAFVVTWGLVLVYVNAVCARNQCTPLLV